MERKERSEHSVRNTECQPTKRGVEQTIKRAVDARHRLSCLSAGKAGRGYVFVSNRIGEIPPSGMIEEDAGNGLRHGLRHRRYPEKGSVTATPSCPPAPHLCPTRLFDLWVQHWRKTKAKGDVIVVRWADDFVVGFEHQADAARFHHELAARFAKFKLKLHPEKTRVIEFGYYAANHRKRRGKGKPETFNFLGFTHICGKKRSNGMFTVLRRTMSKRKRAKLKEIKTELRKRMHQRMAEVGKWLRSVVEGHNRYYGVPSNLPSLASFRFLVGRSWYRSLWRRSQRTRLTWAQMLRLIAHWLPRPTLHHPYPLRRLGVIT